MTSPLNFILRLPFLLALSILILNDHVWKYQFHNFITGKLSDFAGIFLVGILGIIVFPRFKKTILGLIGLGFIWWKSPYSQTAIDWYNTSALIPIGRVVDYGDLMALLMLPIAYVYTQKSRTSPTLSIKTPLLQRSLQFIILGISMLAFMATSPPRTIIECDKTYTFDYSLDELLQKINKIQSNYQDTIDTYINNYSLSTHIENANEIQPRGSDSIYYHVINYRKVDHTYYDENNDPYTETVTVPERYDTIYLKNDSIRLQYYNYQWIKRPFEPPFDCRWGTTTVLITGNSNKASIQVSSFRAGLCGDNNLNKKEKKAIRDFFLQDFEFILIDRL